MDKTPEQSGAEDAQCVIDDSQINLDPREVDDATSPSAVAQRILGCREEADEALINAIGWSEVYELAGLAYDETADQPSADMDAWLARYNTGYRARLAEITHEES